MTLRNENKQHDGAAAERFIIFKWRKTETEKSPAILPLGKHGRNKLLAVSSRNNHTR